LEIGAQNDEKGQGIAGRGTNDFPTPISEKINTDTRMVLLMAPRKMTPKRKGTWQARRERPRAGSDTLNIVLYTAQRTLLEADGRCAGIKFNKLVFSIYARFSKAENPRLRFDLPYRWYLHGAVVEPAGLGGILTIDHPEDEMRSNVLWTGLIPKERGCPPEVRSEVQRLCLEFCERYPGESNFQEMLREHYKSAKLDFQRSFLEWNLLISDMVHGSHEISNQELLVRLEQIATDFPADFEPRLTPAFSRLHLCVSGILEQHPRPTFDDLRILKDLFWDFWSTFCLFLSQRYNNRIPPARLRSYHERAERELLAYKRRLSAALSTAYLDGSVTGKIDDDSLKELSSILMSRVLRYMEE
jgi:hypothetical protein